MIPIGIRDLKNQATEILRTVREDHIEYVVTYRGKPIARLSPLSEAENISKEMVEATPTSGELVADIEQILVLQRDLPSQNRRALAVLGRWLSEPDQDGQEWWDAFNTELERNRFTLRRTEHG